MQRFVIGILVLCLVLCGCGEKALPEEAPQEPLSIVCLGDSVTAGVFELTKDEFGYGYIYDTEAAYPAKLEKLLHEDGIEAAVYDAGISGDTAGMGYDRIASDVLPHDPDIVTVCFGLNDVGTGNIDLYKTDLGRIFTALREYKSDILILFMTPNMLASYVHESVQNDYLNYAMARGNVSITESGALDVFMEAAKEVCSEYGVPVCDAYSHWKQLYEKGEDITALLASYVTHPVREMHDVFASMLYDTMKNQSII